MSSTSLYGHEARVQAVEDVHQYLRDQPTSTLPIAESLFEEARNLRVANNDIHRFEPSMIAKLGTTSAGRIVDLQGTIVNEDERVLHTHLFALARYGLHTLEREYSLTYRHIAAPEQPYEVPTIMQNAIHGARRGSRIITASIFNSQGVQETKPLMEIDYEDLFIALLCSQTVRDVASRTRATLEMTRAQVLKAEAAKDKKAAKELLTQLKTAGLSGAPWAKI